MLTARYFSVSGEPGDALELPEDLFDGVVNEAVLHQVIKAYLANQRQGNASTKTRAEVSGGNSKVWKQKGTGRARHHSARAPQFRGGGRAHGPVVRSHEHDLPKKVRALGLRHALSAKFKAEDIIIVDDLVAKEAKTKVLAGTFASLGLTNALFIGGAELDGNFKLAAKNIPNVDVLPIQGINVYDILRRGKLVLTKAAVEALEERFK